VSEAIRIGVGAGDAPIQHKRLTDCLPTLPGINRDSIVPRVLGRNSDC
jgi:hypothetical protein